MKKFRIFITTTMCAIALTATYFGYTSYQEANMTASEKLFQANLEALTQAEQPDTAECVSDPNYDCEALHPTDPDQDDLRENAKWPTGAVTI